MRRLLAVALVLGCAREDRAPSDAGTPTEKPVEITGCVVRDQKPSDLLADLGNCEQQLGPLAHAARDVAMLERWQRALPLLVAARSAQGFRKDCDVPDTDATRPLLEHPNLDACTTSSSFAPDPWMMDVGFYCVIDIGTFLFLDRVAALLPPRSLEDPSQRMPEEYGNVDASWLRTGFFKESRYVTCDRTHGNYLERQKRIREAADRWNALKGRARKEHRENWLP